MTVVLARMLKSLDAAQKRAPMRGLADAVMRTAEGAPAGGHALVPDAGKSGQSSGGGLRLGKFPD